MATLKFAAGERSIPDEFQKTDHGVTWVDESDDTLHLVPWAAIEEVVEPYTKPEVAFL